LLSALARTEEMAAALVPLAVIPQIILAGVIAPLPDLSFSKILANSFITARWGQCALEALLPSDDLALLGIVRAEYYQQIAMVAVHLAVFAAATLLVLWRRS
jgi:hypothetical protein